MSWIDVGIIFGYLLLLGSLIAGLVATYRQRRKRPKNGRAE